MILPVTVLPLLTMLALVSGVPLPSNVADDEGATNREKDTLRLVTVIIRHGERAPVDTYPNDPYIKDSMKPYGWGQLTNEGRKNQYNQGLFLRKRYDRFLGSTYNPDIFHLQTTATDRTKMSGQLETAALWKPNEDQMFRPDLPWQPIALYYQEFTEDTLMLVWNTCPKYTRLRTSVNDQPEVRQVHEHNQQLFAELTNLTGMPITSVGDVNSLYSTLTAEKEMNLTLPEWTKDYYPDKLLNLTLYDLKLNTYDNSFRRLKGGPLLKKIIDDMMEKKNQTTHPNLRKFIMYMGHDSTIATLLDTMHIWYHQVPHYNIMIMIELHYYENEWNVQIFLRNTTTSEPYPMIIPECSAACPLNKFVEILKPVIPDDWKEECKVEGDYVTPSAPLP